MAGGRQGVPGFDHARFRAARISANLSQVALAEAVGVHVSTIRGWESGRQIPRVDAVAAVARELGRVPSDFLAPHEGAAVTLQQLRAAAGKSQQAIATEAGMLRNTYSAVERGETTTLSYEDTQGLAAAFGITAEQVLAARTASRSAYLAQHPRASGNGRVDHDS